MRQDELTIELNRRTPDTGINHVLRTNGHRLVVVGAWELADQLLLLCGNRRSSSSLRGQEAAQPYSWRHHVRCFHRSLFGSCKGCYDPSRIKSHWPTKMDMVSKREESCGLPDIRQRKSWSLGILDITGRHKIQVSIPKAVLSYFTLPLPL
jgi:hypothetical protein